MTSRERVLTSFSFEEPDRVPVDYRARGEVTDALCAHLGVEGRERLFRVLGVDFRGVGVGEHHPDFEARANGVLEAGRSEKRGRRFVFHSDGSFENAWGVVFRLDAEGRYEEWRNGPFRDTDDLGSFSWPSLDTLEDVESVRARVQSWNGEVAVVASCNYPFKTCWHMRGLENFLCDMLLEQDWARELWQRVARYETERAVRAAAAGVDVVAFVGDIAMQDRMLLSVPAWRAIDKPLFAEMIAAVKRAAPQVKVMYHSDGDLSEIISDLIEIGVDILNPIQPESMDPAELKRRYGSHLILNGAVSLQRMLPFGRPADVRAEIRRILEDCAPHGGFVLAPSNQMQQDTPLENIVEVYRTAGAVAVR